MQLSSNYLRFLLILSFMKKPEAYLETHAKPFMLIPINFRRAVWLYTLLEIDLDNPYQA